MYSILPPGTFLNYGKYEIVKVLGQGGFGITYEATHNVLGSVAIKEFYPQEYAQREHTTGQIVAITSTASYHRALQRFIREGRILEKIDHPNVVRVRDLFEERGTAYLVMNLIQGRTLRDELEQQPNHRLRTAQIGVIIEALVSALETVHKNDIYHLDIKPENILITDDRQVKLIDFGAARQGFSSKTTRAYSPTYAAPEVIAGHEIGAASDLFELGMVLYEMLVGELPATATQRLLGIAVESQDHLNLNSLEQPWRQLLEDALQLKIEQRSPSIRQWWNQAETYWQEQQNQQAIPESPPTTATNTTAKWTAGIVTAGIASTIVYLNLPKTVSPMPSETLAPIAASIEPTTIPCNLETVLRSLPAQPTYTVRDPNNGREFKFYGKLDAQNRLQGSGTVIYSDSSRYDGNFSNGKRSGCGLYTYASEETTLKSYVGQFQADKFEGLGVLSFKNGNRYIGEFRQNQCHGRGVFILSDGTKKSGTWAQDESPGNPSCSRGA